MSVAILIVNALILVFLVFTTLAILRLEQRIHDLHKELDAALDAANDHTNLARFKTLSD